VPDGIVLHNVKKKAKRQQKGKDTHEDYKKGKDTHDKRQTQKAKTPMKIIGSKTS